MAKETGGMGLKEARELAELIRQQSVLSKGLRAYTAIVTLDDRITEIEEALRRLLKEPGYSGSLQGYPKARENALKVLAKGE